MSEWKQTINIFLTSFVAILTLAVAEITAIALTPAILWEIEILDGFASVGAIIVILVIWNRRIPKVDLEKAEEIAIGYVKNKNPTIRGASLDRNKRGFRKGRKWHIFVNHLTATGVYVVTLEVVIDAGAGKAESVTPRY